MTKKRLVERIGERFGRLQVVAITPERRVICLCDCGVRKELSPTNVFSGRTNSCGCFNREVAAARLRRHGGVGTRTHKTWESMNNRCYCKGDAKAYAKYGARGIGICARWRQSFANFLEDMGERPEGMTLGRIDNNADYSPENCRWETVTQQARNKRNTKMDAETALAIRAAAQRGMRRREIAENFGVKRSMVHDIVSGRQWK